LTWRPFFDASWQHEFMQNSNSLTAGFDGAGVGTFTVPTPGNSRESALVSLGTDIDIDANSEVFTVYRVEAGASNFFAQSVEAGFELSY
jgi:outer membrane autotransporter protein